MVKTLILRVVCLFFGHEWEDHREWDAPMYCRLCGARRKDV